MASNTKYYGLHNKYTHKAKLKNNNCGDIIIVELNTNAKDIISMRYETQSCVFCQASASILANKIKLFTKKNLRENISFFKSIIRGEHKKIPSMFKPFKELLNKENLNRADCIMLPYNAIIKALKI
jgi:nitrogen fixation NifU-like protein